jgi:hypothetical protein
MIENAKSVEPKNGKDGSWLEIVRQQVGSLRFGVVQIVVHESRVVQVERTEKVRIAQTQRSSDEATGFANRKTGGGKK